MHIDHNPRNPAITTDTQNPGNKDTGENHHGVTPSEEKSFSPAHLPAGKSPTTAPEKSSANHSPPTPAKEKPFQRNTNARRLDHAEKKLREALDSPENKMYQEHLGILSPEAESRLNEYEALFDAKSSDSKQSQVFRSAYGENFITPDDATNKQSIERQLPARSDVHGTVSKPLGKVREHELVRAIYMEPGFSVFFGTPEGDKFIRQLGQTLAKKSAEMNPTDKGMALVFRFPGTYGAVGHMALGALWRDENGLVRLDISHQESVAPTKQSGFVYTGKIFNTFDTSSVYPTKIAPVVESMKLFGPPSVNVFPIPFPERLSPYTRLFKDHEVTYGAANNWRPGKNSTIPKQIHYETCFDVTHKTLAKLYGITTAYEPLLPTRFPKTKGLVGIPDDKFTTFKDKDGIHPLDKTGTDPDAAVAVFGYIGTRWIDEGIPDVQGQTKIRTATTKFQPDQVGFALPRGVAGFKFAAESNVLKPLQLDGKPVIKDKAYTAEEAMRMTYTDKKPSRDIPYVFAEPQGMAKL